MVSLEYLRQEISMVSPELLPGITARNYYFVCPHCNEKTEIFSHGGGEKTSERYNVPLLGGIPLDTAIREGGDTGNPIAITNPDSPHAGAFMDIACKVASRISVL